MSTSYGRRDGPVITFAECPMIIDALEKTANDFLCAPGRAGNIGLQSADMRKQLREEPFRTGRWPRGSGARRSSHDPQLQHARRGQPSGATGLNPTPQPSIPHRRPPQP